MIFVILILMDKRSFFERFNGCAITSSQQRICRTNEQGEEICKTSKRVVRKCPGKEPEVLSSEEGDIHPLSNGFNDMSVFMQHLKGFESSILFDKAEGDAIQEKQFFELDVPEIGTSELPVEASNPFVEEEQVYRPLRHIYDE